MFNSAAHTSRISGFTFLVRFRLLPAVGGFEAEADSTSANTVKLTGCQWGGSADANGVAELVILTRQNV